MGLSLIRVGGFGWANEFGLILPSLGLVYAVTHRGSILCFDAKDGYSRRSRRSKVKILAPKTDPPTFSKREYLVKSSSGGDLFYVQRNLDLTLQHTNHFKVYKLLLDEQSGEVMDRIEEKSLGGDTFFVGTNYSKSFSISTAAKFPGCQPNSIYFTPDYFGSWCIQ